MRNHQQHDPQTADIAKLGDATFVRDSSTAPYWKFEHECMSTDQLIRYKATFWKKIEPEPGYRLVEDHERVGEKPEGLRVRCKDGRWFMSHVEVWEDELTYAVPTKQVVAWLASDAPTRSYTAFFATKELRDRAVWKANRGGVMKTAESVMHVIRSMVRVTEPQGDWDEEFDLSHEEAIRLIESRDAEIHALYAPVVERVDSALDSYCQYFLADDDSQEESQWRKQMEMDIASLAIEVRGENFLIDFDNKLAAIKEIQNA